MGLIFLALRVRWTVSLCLGLSWVWLMTLSSWKREKPLQGYPTGVRTTMA
jgi:hypothetical protein